MKSLFLFLSLAVSACAQTYTVISPESQFITINIPAGTTWQIGNVADNKWSAGQTVTSAVSFTAWYGEFVNYPYISSFPDPDPTKPEVFRVLQTSTPQSVSITDRSVIPNRTVNMTVPAAAAITPPPAIVPVSQTPCLCTEFSDSHFECVATGPKTAVK